MPEFTGKLRFGLFGGLQEDGVFSHVQHNDVGAVGLDLQVVAVGAVGAHARAAGAWQAPGQFHSYKAVALPGPWLADTAAVFSPQKPLVFVGFYLQSNIMLLVKKEVKKKKVKPSKA